MSKHPLLHGARGERHVLLGNEAIVRGALEAGVNMVTCYPGTPSSEVSDTFYKLGGEGRYKMPLQPERAGQPLLCALCLPALFRACVRPGSQGHDPRGLPPGPRAPAARAAAYHHPRQPYARQCGIRRSAGGSRAHRGLPAQSRPLRARARRGPWPSPLPAGDHGKGPRLCRVQPLQP